MVEQYAQIFAHVIAMAMTRRSSNCSIIAALLLAPAADQTH